MISLLIGVFSYYAFTALISVRSQNAEEYVSAKEQTGWPTLTLSLLATTVGGGMFLGIAELGYRGSFTFIVFGVIYLFANILVGYLAPQMRRLVQTHKCSTLFGVIESIYPSQGFWSISIWFAICTMVVFLLMLAVQYVSLGQFVAFYFKVNHNVGIAIASAALSLASIVLYSAIGGFKRDLARDVFQMSVITLGIALLFQSLVGAGAIESAAHIMNDDLFIPTGHDVTILFGALLVVMPTFLVRFDVWQRVLTAKNDQTARTAFLLSGVGSLIFFFAFGCVGWLARGSGVPSAEFVGLGAIELFSAKWQYPFMIIAFFAAVMSSGDTFLGVSGIAVAKTLFYRSDQLEGANVSVRRLRWVTFACGAVAIGFAYVIRDIVDLFASAFGILSVFIPALLGGLISKAHRRFDAWLSIVLGLLVCIAGFILRSVECFVGAFVISSVAYLLAAMLSRPRARVSAQ